MTMIKVLTVGRLQEHTYFFIDEKTKHGFLVDPGDEAERILSEIMSHRWVIEKIILTHGHFDHIGAVEQIRNAIGCPVVIHEEGKAYLQNAEWNLSSIYGIGYTFDADEYVQHGDVIVLETNPDMNLRVIHAPGHTSDGAAYFCEKEKTAFVGDIIFNGAVGRCDNPGGNMNRLLSSIRAQIFTLPDETVLFPGHGPSTTVKHEKATNPFFNLYE
ncbi:MAG: fold metallo-hydrolase [Clostridia bacterium]|jgi:glyoxylase-like metal-dependent hydrolase (beta-lactamase superfamily II)|nr:fold metallo-hydrolase [Clostridia bacterium]